VKFQTFKASNLTTKFASKASYQLQNTVKDEGQLEMLRRLELTEGDHDKLLKYCSDVRIKFLSTPFDIESIELLKKMNIPLGKIPSGEITNLPFLRKMASSFSKIILSTGMSSMKEIEDAYNAIINTGFDKSNLFILHCNTEYPTPFEDVHLNAMNSIRDKFNVKVGYSDHTLGIEVPIAAVALGAEIIEKHFTLDRSMEGPDHIASLEPEELYAMVSSIRNIEKALGSNIKQPSDSEFKNRLVTRKSIVASRFISKGEFFSHDNLTVKRPGTGLSPMLWDEVIGMKANKSYEVDELIAL
jgi:N,N'-diacetyllegionaminate synthase